jgi:hypothetical protein
MRDGVRIAIDVHLPARLAPGERRPTIVRQTRYFRSVRIKPPFARLPIAELPDLYARTRRLFLAAGYAWVDVDVRGSGASFGTQPFPWSDDEVRDGAEVVDWIVRQPWSDGTVGSLGISYDGTAAEMLLRNRHPAVRAVAPLFSLFDVYADVAFPGGVHLSWFTEAWNRFNQTLDANAFDRAMAQALWLMLRGARPGEAGLVRAALDALPEARCVEATARALRAMVGGVRPVDDDAHGALLSQAVAGHAANFDVHAGALQLTHRDDRGVSDRFPDATIDAFSPHAHAGDVAASGAAIYSVSGWRDGAYPHAAIKRFRTVRTPGSRLTLGPLGHGGKLYVSPSHPTRPAAFDLDGELLAFFDLHLRGRDAGLRDEPPVHYYTTGEEAWKSASTWPPPGTTPRVLHLAPERALAWEAPSREGEDAYAVDPGAGSGERSRWRALLGAYIQADYPDRAERDARLLTYTSPPLERDLEVTGHPLLTLFVITDSDDATVHAYLEEVTADGRVCYVTEGQLRALHRAVAPDAPYASAVPYHSFRRADAAPLVPGQPAELVIDLLPVSHRFRRGSALRLALAGADRDHFRAPPSPPGVLRVQRRRLLASRLELPVMG